MLAAKDISILIADDDRGCREALQEIVEPRGYRTLLAESGEEALAIVQGETVHLVMLDMHMHQLTGLETLQLARQIRQQLPAILITADATQSLMREAAQAQVTSVIPKPFSKTVVLYTLIHALARFYGQLRDPADG